MNRRIIAVATLMLLVVMSLASCSDNDEDKTALFECGNEAMPDGVVTAKLQRYGASYLTGAMVSEDQAILVLGMEGDEMVDDASQRFTDGHQAHSTEKLHRLVLASDYSGFNMPIEAYSRVDSIYINDKPEEGKLPLWASVRSFSHVYSVAGGSNGSLTGYAAGLKRKQGLLDIERG